MVIEYVIPPAADVSENLRSIAVLPFDNRSAEEENAAFLADGVHDELLTRLSKIHDLKVISRTSVMEYRDTTKNMRQIGAELGVGSILEGGVQRAGDTVRINVQLIDVQEDEHLWANTYDRELSATNIFAIQTEISTAIANALRATLSSDEQERIAKIPTENFEALQAFFTANQLLPLVVRRDVEAFDRVLEHYERAIELDPDFAGAYAGLAKALLDRPRFFAPTDLTRIRAEGEAALQKAIELEPDLPDALSVLGWYKLLYEYDWTGAVQLFKRALLIQPNNVVALHWYSHLLSWQGKHSESLELAERAVAADPLSRGMQTHLSNTYADAGNFDEFLSISERIIRCWQHPNTMRAHWLRQLEAGRAEDAAAMLENWAEATDRSAETAQELGTDFIQFQQTGVPVEVSDALIERFQFGDVNLARIYASVGDKEKTIRALQDAYRRHTDPNSLLSMKINPSYDFIRDDPRFVELLDTDRPRRLIG